MMAGAMLLCGLGAWAQEPGVTAEMAHTMSVREIVETGGWLMYVLGAMSVVGLATVSYTHLTLPTKA
jgi:hypothetical protein